MRQLNIATVIIALLVSLGLMLGGQHLYEKYYVKESLEKKIARVVKVKELRIEKKEKPPTVYLRPSQLDDLQTVYRQVAEIVHHELGPDYRLVFLDERTPKLIAVYEKSQFAIQEAIATGCFQKMDWSVQQLTQANHVNCRLTVDSYNVYLQLQDRDGYLYEVIQRSPQQLGSVGLAARGGEAID